MTKNPKIRIPVVVIVCVLLLAATLSAGPAQSSSSQKQGLIKTAMSSSAIKKELEAPSDSGKIYVFYVIHVHGPEDGRPEFAPITKEEFEGVSRAVKKIAQTLEAHGAKGTFEFLQNYADAVKKYQGAEANILIELMKKGHEVGVHAHSHLFNQWEKTKNSLLSAGVKNVTTIGGRAFGLNLNDPGFKLAAESGYKIVTDNYSPLDHMTPSFIKNCRNWGFKINNAYSDTGSFIHPWRPDYLNNNVCNNSINGKILYLDHISGDWLRADERRMFGPPKQRMMIKENYMARTLSSEQFSRIKPMFDNAIVNIASDRFTVWGFVSHEVEYYEGAFPHLGTEKLNSDALDALSEFLAYINRHKDRVEWLTAREILDRYIKWETGHQR